jgi:hypothetical protein
MQNVSTVNIDGTEYEMWDSTKLKSYACEERGRLEHEEHLIPKEPREAIAFGQMLHKGVEVWTRQAAIHKLPEGDAINIAEKCALEEWEKELPLEYREMLEFSGDRRCYANFKRLFLGFRTRFPLAEYKEIVECEKPFALPLGTTRLGVKVAWCGKRDRVLRMWDDTVKYADVKTSTFSPDAAFFDQFRLSGQMIGYAWAGQLELGMQFDGILIQAVQVQAPLKTKTRKPEDLCAADTIDISDSIIEQWANATLTKIDRIYMARDTGTHAKDFGELCRSYNRACQMAKFCLAPPEMAHLIKEEHYRVRQWSPFTESSDT